eukprot:CAMPEP_0184703500 /NCGR_PEP_ID=MMETSP0313-20130426/27980_1 /TAXON_ID=2792 /ORGANISM="Porphyridium aerugineum, Strain SAG 1380-2" /LENGTH=73 /DNA_ID=CAMNT_0027164275 /DNA_START=111 /DNA_END=332 /DNA_ORIENTATION=-
MNTIGSKVRSECTSTQNGDTTHTRSYLRFWKHSAENVGPAAESVPGGAPTSSGEGDGDARCWRGLITFGASGS